MKVLQEFSDKEENYHMYASRLDYQRVQWALEDDARESKAELEQAKILFAQQLEEARKEAKAEARKEAKAEARRLAAQEVQKVKQQLMQQLQAAQDEIARLKSGQR